MARALKGSHSFTVTCTHGVHRNEPYLPVFNCGLSIFNKRILLLLLFSFPDEAGPHLSHLNH